MGELVQQLNMKLSDLQYRYNQDNGNGGGRSERSVVNTCKEDSRDYFIVKFDYLFYDLFRC